MIQWTMETFLPQRKKRTVKKNVFTWLSATARHFGLTTRKPNGATSKWQATQNKILNFGRETLIAPAAIQTNVEVSLIFSSSKQAGKAKDLERYVKAGKAKDLERYVVVAINSENKGWQRTLGSWSSSKQCFAFHHNVIFCSLQKT